MVKDIPQSNKQHAVPQNIMDVEFKLIGQLTMRQFSYLLMFGLLGYFIQQVLIGILKWPLALTSWFFAVGFAFIPIEERGMDEWVVNFVKAVYKPTQKIWKKTPEIPTALNYKNMDIVKQELITLAPTASRRRLEEYLEYKENEEIDPLDIPEQEYLMKIQQAYVDSSSQSQAKVKAKPKIRTQKPTQQKSFQKPSSDKSSQKENDKSMSEKEAIVRGESEIIKPRDIPSPGIYKPKRSILKPMTPDMHSGRKFTNLLPSRGELVLPIRGEKVIDISDQVNTDDVKAKAAKLQQLLSEIKRSEGIVTRKKVETKVISPEPIDEKTEKEVQDIISKLKLEIKKITDRLIQVKKDSTLKNKDDLIQQLQNQKRQIEEKYQLLNDQMSSLKKEISKGSKEITEPSKKKSVSEVSPLSEDIDKAINEPIDEKTEKDVLDLISKLKLEIKKITDRLSQVKEDSTLTNKEDLIQQLQHQKRQIEEKYQLLNDQMSSLKKETSKENKKLPVSSQSVSISDAFTKHKSVNEPNVVCGVVMDSSRNPMPGILLIIRDEKEEPIRAFKTNALGQFFITTPLKDGSYTLEVSKTNNIDLSFDIISIEAKGDIIPPLEIKGK